MVRRSNAEDVGPVTGRRLPMTSRRRRKSGEAEEWEEESVDGRRLLPMKRPRSGRSQRATTRDYDSENTKARKIRHLGENEKRTVAGLCKLSLAP